jgi:dipeptidyl-peptidase-4
MHVTSSRLALVALLLVALAGCATPEVAPPSFESLADGIEDSSREVNRFDPGGRVRSVRWSADGESVFFTRGGERYRFDLDRGAMEASDDDPRDVAPDRPGRRRRPGRGRQRDRETSPDGRWVAVSADWNVTIEPGEPDDDAVADAEGGPAAATTPMEVTSDGHRKLRYGTASWVYGEELDQQTAMWWSPDSRTLVFYEFDEREVPDFYLLEGLADWRTAVLREGYPKPGDPNPVARLLAYDVETGATRTLDTTGPEDEAGGHPWYIYAVRFTPDGSALLYHQLNRRQDLLRLRAVDLATGTARTIVTERQATWQRARPTLRFLDDGQRFLWETEASGFRRLVLRDLDGALLAELTPPDVDLASIVRLDEDAGELHFTARGGDHPLDVHLYRVRLDGTGLVRLTEGAGAHSPNVAPGGAWFVTTRQRVDLPPVTTLHDRDGRLVATLAESDDEAIAELGYPAPELFTVKAADGETDLYGYLHKPRDFDPARVYPLVISVYGGPTSAGFSNRYRPGFAACDYGFIVARLENRGCLGRGKAFQEPVYGRLGDVDLADQAAGARQLSERPYIDADRVGIYGHSYGGFMAALAILKHPDVFSVSVASSPVTDWRNYDSIYTERFMGMPDENADGYDAGSCRVHAANLRGHLLVQHGMVDDNVHPNNAWQLVDALQKAEKSCDMHFYPASGHSLRRGHASRGRWAYLYEHLIARP